jgi:hypothetical protein
VPIYYVYNAQSGDIVQRHEAYSAASGYSLRCSDEDVLALVDESLKSQPLRILEVEAPHPEESTLGGRTVRVDLNTGKLVAHDGN